MKNLNYTNIGYRKNVLTMLYFKMFYVTVILLTNELLIIHFYLS